MVIDLETLTPLHQLTKAGEKHYREFLEAVSDEMILKDQHSIIYWSEKICEFFGFNESFINQRYNAILKQIQNDRK